MNDRNTTEKYGIQRKTNPFATASLSLCLSLSLQQYHPSSFPVLPLCSFTVRCPSLYRPAASFQFFYFFYFIFFFFSSHHITSHHNKQISNLESLQSAITIIPKDNTNSTITSHLVSSHLSPSFP